MRLASALREQLLSMPTDITVVVADTTLTPAIRAGLSLSGRVAWFSDAHLGQALESIQLNHPRVIAVEASFAQRPQGQAFLTRIERLSIRGAAIQLVVRANGKWGTTPHIAQPAPEESQTVVGSVITERSAAAMARLATLAPQPKAANTRRANRFKVLESLNAIVENGQADVVNMSVFGAQVVSKPALYPAQRLKIALPDEDDMLRLTGYVAWSTFEQILPRTDTQYRAGVAFADAAQEILEDYCRRHCAQDPLPSY